MDKKKLEKDLTQLAQPIVEGLSYELVAVEFLKEDGEYYLRIYIDKPGGIDIDDCSSVSRLISDKLDEVDPIEESYYLEVSSPGPDRMIVKEADFERFAGSQIKIKLIKLWQNKKHLQGTLIGLDPDKDEVVVEIDGKHVKINRDNTSYIKLNDR